MRGRREPGFTLMEVIVILGVIAILAAIIAPLVVRYLDDANKVRAESDVRAIAAAILKFHQDTSRFPYFNDGNASGTTPNYDILTGSGTAPTDGTGTALWNLGTATKDTLDNQIQRNQPGGDATKAYKTTGRFAWKGPYLDTVAEDPWGNQYLVNIAKLKPGDNKQAWVISSGPNGKIETVFDVLNTGAVALGGDDIGARIQ